MKIIILLLEIGELTMVFCGQMLCTGQAKYTEWESSRFVICNCTNIRNISRSEATHLQHPQTLLADWLHTQNSLLSFILRPPFPLSTLRLGSGIDNFRLFSFTGIIGNLVLVSERKRTADLRLLIDNRPGKFWVWHSRTLCYFFSYKCKLRS